MLSALDTRTSPFSEGQIQRLRQGLEGLDPAQSAWLSGYLAGRLAAASAPGENAATAPAAASAPVLEIFYATETGNGEGVAEALARRAGEVGLQLPVRSLDGYRPAGLARLRRAVFVISTHGEGDPPEEAADLFAWLDSPRAADLSQLEFRVLALGDSSYAHFCEAGRKLEQLLEARGARVFAPRVECDVDYDDAASAWSAEVLDYARRQAADSAADSGVHSGPEQLAHKHLSVVPAESGWSRKRPFKAEVLDIRKITGLDSSKEVYHLELSLADSGIRYEPGDALGVWPLNAEENVSAVLDGLGIEPSRTVLQDGETRSMRDWLLRYRELTRLTPATLRSYAELAQDGSLAKRLDSLAELELRNFLETRQFVDLVEEFPARIAPEQLLELLRPLSPRSYSIASSQEALGDEVHLTVASLFSDAIGRPRRGVASEHLNRTLAAGDRVGVYLEPNRRFRLPEDATAPLVMIGAGTGIAPYRAFMQQLEAGDRNPDSWLIFGNPNLRSDFLYQREWLRWREQGLLRRIDCAFSRDQEHKRYVQHIVEENADGLSEWLGRGAHLYLCGGLAMGQAVEQALLRHVAPRFVDRAGNAEAWLAELRQQRRLARDLY